MTVRIDKRGILEFLNMLRAVFSKDHYQIDVEETAFVEVFMLL